MKRNRKWVAMVLTAAFVFGGAMAAAPKAFADDDEESYVSKVKASLNKSQFTADWQKQLINNTSIVADKDYSEIRDILDDNGTLIQASGLSGAALFDGLRDKLDQEIASASQAYLIDDQQLSVLRSDLYSLTQSAINTPGFKPQTASKNSFHFKAILKEQLAGLSSAASSFSSEDSLDVKDRLLAGETIVEATRMDASLLLNNLLTSINGQIQAAQNSGAITSEDADQYRNEAKNAFSAAITAPGGVKPEDKAAASKAQFDALIQGKLESIASTAYLVSGLEDEGNDFLSDYNNGSSLVRLTGLSADELAQRIAKVWEQDTDAWSASAGLTDEEKEELEQQVLNQIRAALNQ
ncbi:hypothetical protein DVH26_33570 [Paenibacillus sp. H1-7]|uniref:hypothetical protein n=1 Tax=Paenibacillus sp. H1-7 TaxID=2282849 RepID=UPI001EF8724E|nr:hypothetical protein [Paenibacillus sp. H1-7]ULL18934.1 hypothetical protein DVH26_33570 [Paenibacillus sp. H1-7]